MGSPSTPHSAQQEWDALVALVPYFVDCPGPTHMRERLRNALAQYSESRISRNALLLYAGLSFFADHLEADLALMQLVREGLLRPVADDSFTFTIHHPKGVALCVPSKSKPGGGSG